jgi:hypothetical protein
MAAESTSRPRRDNAGRNIGKLISQEEDGGDEFYSTAYGGFTEESEDEEYEVSNLSPNKAPWPQCRWCYKIVTWGIGCVNLYDIILKSCVLE